jgi:hypothetical protein
VLALRDGETALSGPTDVVFRKTEAIAAAGLLPPPLAQVAALARAQGLLREEPTSLTAEALAEALARAAPFRWLASERRWVRTEGGDHAG